MNQELIDQGHKNANSLKPGDLVMVTNEPGYLKSFWTVEQVIRLYRDTMPTIRCKRAFEVRSGREISSKRSKEFRALAVTKVEPDHIHQMIDDHLQAINKLKYIAGIL